MGKPPPLAVRLAQALPFQRAQGERRCVLTAHDYRHTANGAPTNACVVSGRTPKQGRRHDPYATAAGGFQGLQALSLHRWPPLGAFIKLPALRVVHDLSDESGLSQKLVVSLSLRDEQSQSQGTSVS